MRGDLTALKRQWKKGAGLPWPIPTGFFENERPCRFQHLNKLYYKTSVFSEGQGAYSVQTAGVHAFAIWQRLRVESFNDCRVNYLPLSFSFSTTLHTHIWTLQWSLCHKLLADMLPFSYSTFHGLHRVVTRRQKKWNVSVFFDLFVSILPVPCPWQK